jgi:uncharacterized protein
MILIDANLLLHAFDASSPRHEPARRWFEDALGGVDPVRFALQSILGFVRISTNPAVYERPLRPGDAIAIVESWLSRPTTGIAAPGERHWRIFAEVALGGQARGPQLMDAHLAALAIEHGAMLATTDRGFARFPGLRFRNPIAA